MKMEECANCMNKVDNERSNLFTQPLPLLITIYDEEGVSTREKGEVSIYEALVDVFSLRSNAHLINLLESGMRAPQGDVTGEKCLLSLCHECAFRLANLYELCQEFTQLSVKAKSFLYPIIAKVTVKAEILENNVVEKRGIPPPTVDGEGVIIIAEFAGENSKGGSDKSNADNENCNDNEAPDDDDQYYPLSPLSNHGNEDSDSEEGGVAGRVRRRMEKLALRKMRGVDINDLLEVTNAAADWLSSSDSEEEDNETSDDTYVESEPETTRKNDNSEKSKETLDTGGNPEDPTLVNSAKTIRRNRVREKLTCPKCGRQYVNRACYEKHLRRHKSRFRRIRKGAAKYISIKDEAIFTNQGDQEEAGENVNLDNQLTNGLGENNYPSDGSGEDEEIIRGGRQRKRWRITDEDDEWNPKKRKPHRRSAAPFIRDPPVEEEKVRVPCTICGNTFMSNGHLVQHMKTHTKPKNACILCGKEYRYPSELKVHLESHQRMKEKRLNSGKFKSNTTFLRENAEHLLNSDFSDDGEVPSPIPVPASDSLPNPLTPHSNVEILEGSVISEATDTKITAKEELMEPKTEPSMIVTCTVCGKHFRHPHFLQMHMQTHSKAIKCTQCPEVFTTPKDLREHKIAHRLERRATIEPMSCKYCGKQYYDETHLFRHQESHELPPPLFPCELCGKTFTRKQKLKLHIDTVHTTERPYRCHLCPLAYSRKDKLNAHVTKAHGEELKCDLCGKSFIGEASLKIHRVKHAFEAPREFQCEQCGRKYQQLKHLKNHIKFMHRKRTANVCQTCGKTFGRASCLKKHEISHQEIGSHLCSQCGKAYKHERSLILHEQKEHLGESSYQYECSICMKRFHRKELLQNHQVLENHMVPGSGPIMIMPIIPDVMREVPPLVMPEHFLQMPTTGLGEMLNLDTPNPLDLIHAATSTTNTDPDKYRTALSAISEASIISEASMFVAQNF